MSEQQIRADKIPKIVWVTRVRVCRYQSTRATEFAVDSLRRKGYEVVKDRDGDYAVVSEPQS